MKSLGSSYAGFAQRMLLGIALLLSLTGGREIQGAQPALADEDVVGASRLAGLEFSEAEVHLMMSRLNDHLNAVVEMRGSSLVLPQMPALRFDPRPPGFVMPAAESVSSWQPSRRTRLRQDRADWAFLSVEELAGLEHPER